MRIKKIKITKEKRIHMIYEQKCKSGYAWDEFGFTCSEEAKPSFYAALEALALDVIKMCELPEDYLERIKVRSVTFSYGGQANVMGATISAGMDLEESNAPLNLNTPHKAEDSYSEAPADPKQLLDNKCIKILYQLQKEAEAYIKGDRAQGTLFPEVNSSEGVQASAQLN